MTFSSSINTGLQQVPDLTDINTPGKLAYQFISLYNAVNILAQTIDSYTGNAPATSQSTSTSTPAEQTILVGNTSNFYCQAAQNISAGFLVTLGNASGVTTASLANASIPADLAMGISMTTASAGQQIQILLLGLFNFGGSVTPGAIYYLSDSFAGGLTTTAPTPTGHIVQPVGFGVDSNSIWFNPSLNPKVN